MHIYITSMENNYKDFEINLGLDDKLFCIKNCAIGTSFFTAGTWYDPDYQYPGLSGSTLNMGSISNENFITHSVYDYMNNWIKLINKQKNNE